MLKINSFLSTPIFIFSLIFCSLSHAHEGSHEHVLDKNAVITKAQEMISTAIEKKKIDPSWGDAKLEEVKTITIKSTDEWFLKFTNPKINPPKRHLYLFFTLDGKFLAMNYTGK
jgi:hypothetical protein|tara:strand:+ start:30147 stop:30488 length:342 start_codon:yes stop_codon:yes gene_type:complete